MEGVIHSHLDDPNFSNQQSGFGKLEGDVQKMQATKYNGVSWYLAAPDGTLKVARGADPNRFAHTIATNLTTAEEAYYNVKEGKKISKIVDIKEDKWDGPWPKITIDDPTGEYNSDEFRPPGYDNPLMPPCIGCLGPPDRFDPNRKDSKK